MTSPHSNGDTPHTSPEARASPATTSSGSDPKVTDSSESKGGMTQPAEHKGSVLEGRDKINPEEEHNPLLEERIPLLEERIPPLEPTGTVDGDRPPVAEVDTSKAENTSNTDNIGSETNTSSDVPEKRVAFAQDAPEEEAPQPASGNHDVETPGPEDEDGTMVTAETGKKKKKSRRTKSQKKRGTGFEEYYTDPPITPSQYQEERETYSIRRPFTERIEECIQRYRARRRLDSEKGNIFTKYLIVGGVESGPRQFTGMDQELIQHGGLDKEEIQAMTAIDFVGSGENEVFYTSGTEGWEVDFAGVVAGFFSFLLPETTGYRPTQNIEGINIVLNFLNYVVLHEVCPEYADNLEEARRICKVAKEEINTIYDTRELLSESFTTRLTAAIRDPSIKFEGLDQVLLSVRLYGDAELKARFPTDLTVVKGVTTDRRLEVLDISCGKDWVDIVREPHLANIMPIGCFTVRDTFIEDGFSNTPLESEFDPDAATVQTFTLWAEDECLAYMRVGQKIRADIMELDNGLRLLQKMSQVYPSYYVFLPQNLMTKYKKPVESLRPAPTVDNIQKHIDEEGMDADDL